MLYNVVQVQWIYILIYVYFCRFNHKVPAESPYSQDSAGPLRGAACDPVRGHWTLERLQPFLFEDGPHQETGYRNTKAIILTLFSFLFNIN